MIIIKTKKSVIDTKPHKTRTARDRKKCRTNNQNQYTYIS